MKKTTIFLLILLAVLFTSTLYFLYLNEFKSPSVNTSIPTAKLIPTIVPTVQWKLYTNKEYAFSFSYPSDWNIVENSISDTVSAITADKKAHQIEIKYQNQTALLINPELPLGYGSPFSLSTATIDSKKIDVYSYGSSPTKHYTNFNLPNFPKFSIDTYGQNPEITQILSTFKFTESTANLKIYENSEFSFSFKYPSDYKLTENYVNPDHSLYYVSVFKSNNIPQNKGYTITDKQLKVEFYIQKMTVPMTAKEYFVQNLEKQDLGSSTNLIGKEVKINGYTSWYQSSTEISGSESYTFTNNKIGYFVVKYPFKTSLQKDFDQILSTLKFLP